MLGCKQKIRYFLKFTFFDQSFNRFHLNLHLFSVSLFTSFAFKRQPPATNFTHRRTFEQGFVQKIYRQSKAPSHLTPIEPHFLVSCEDPAVWIFANNTPFIPQSIHKTGQNG